MLKHDKNGLLASSSKKSMSNPIRKFNVSLLTVSITSLICMSLPSYASDIEIYAKPASSAGSGVVVMMLDTSGSMDLTANNYGVGLSACDIPPEVSTTNSFFGQEIVNGYSKNYCSVGGVKAYKYLNDWFGRWYSCSSGGTCSTRLNSAPSLSGLTAENNGFETYYYSVTGGTKYYDRISKLKDALYQLATTPAYSEITKTGIKSDVKIGIGTFPYISSSENNQRGYIRIPAQVWGEVGSPQRTAVLNLIKSANFKGQGGTPTSAAYAEAAAYLLGKTTGGGSYSGIGLVTDSNIGTTSKYKSPIDTTTAKECSGQGIYFLTDGQPQSPSGTDTLNLMRKALNDSAYNFSSGLSGGVNDGVSLGGGFYAKSDWQAIGSFAKSLNDPAVIKKALGTNDSGRVVSTAVVGFGSVFDKTYAQMDTDGKNATSWGLKNSLGGVYGEGGFLGTSDPAEIVRSLNEFIGEISGQIPSVSTGSSTIPKDALNPEIIQPFSYFPQFEPKVESANLQQLWLGNLKKYYVVNNGVYSNAAGGSSSIVVKDNKLQDLSDIWAKSGISYPNTTPIFQKGGALSKLLLGTTVVDKKTVGRKLLTDYTFGGSTNLDLNQISYTYTTDTATKADPKARALMALLGYTIPETTQTSGLDLTKLTPDLRQMGSVMHSLPLLLTQSGQPVATLNNGKVVIDSSDRQDYVLFGTTQGLVQVVDAKDGVEKFSFIPNEIINRQPETFKLNGGALTGGKDSLYYGMDGEWVSHTVYVSDKDGKLTVQDAVRNALGTQEDKENLEGKQWVYGGMRMGGRSYYALDLTNINTPKVKFHIDPTTGKVYSQDHPTGQTYDVLQNMGQSWSKPKLDYINWKGQRKLVMFVGGGYDAGGPNGDGTYSTGGVRTGYQGYEYYNYKQNEATCTVNDNTCGTGSKGAGVYMFDADNGDLLWYVDANAPKTGGGSSPSSGGVVDLTTAHLVNENLKYSVASEIKTVDRNNDGVVDHIYFGDLAGQAFRVDFKNDGSKTKFDSQITRVLNLHKNDGTSPRFYYPPVFTAHHSVGKNEGGNIVMAIFISGNKSSPLLGTADSPLTTGKRNSTGLEFDGVYAVYEYQIFPTGSYYPSNSTADKTLATSATAASLTQLMPLSQLVKATTDTVQRGAMINSSNGWGGWYYKFNNKAEVTTSVTEAIRSTNASVIKGIAPLIAMDGNLYVTMFDSSEAGTSSSCGAGVKGQSFTKRICLPTGVCPELADYTYNLGAGIVSLSVGPIDDNGGKGIIVPDPDKAGPFCKGSDCLGKPNFIPSTNALKFIPNRWYERYGKAS